jgi:hypothetical protein
MSNSQKKTAILKSHENWDDWIQFIRFKCSKHIWEIIDPELRNDLAEKPILKPIRPKPSNIRARAQDITHFTAEEMAKYKDLRMFYTQDFRNYTSENNKLTAARNKVFESITPALRDLLKPDLPLRQWMKRLYQKYAPTKQQQEDLLRKQYRKAISTAVIIKKAEDWLLN